MGKISIGPKQELNKQKLDGSPMSKNIEYKIVEVIKEVPVEVERIVERIVEVPVEIIKEVPVEVERIVEVIKEVPVIKETTVEVEKVIEKIKEVPVFLDRITVKYKTHPRMWLVVGLQFGFNVVLLMYILK